VVLHPPFVLLSSFTPVFPPRRILTFFCILSFSSWDRGLLIFHPCPEQVFPPPVPPLSEQFFPTYLSPPSRCNLPCQPGKSAPKASVFHRTKRAPLTFLPTRHFFFHRVGDGSCPFFFLPFNKVLFLMCPFPLSFHTNPSFFL